MSSQGEVRPKDMRVPRARSLRSAMTDAERKLWWHLRRLPKSGSHWRRQATIGPYFADFSEHNLRIVIELDGGQHAEQRQAARDAARTAYLNGRGYCVLRFWNNDVLNNLEAVLTAICATIEETRVSRPPTPNPSPPQAGGGEEKVS
jgi:very-short-patch-repair endonuclease